LVNLKSSYLLDEPISFGTLVGTSCWLNHCVVDQGPRLGLVLSVRLSMILVQKRLILICSIIVLAVSYSFSWASPSAEQLFKEGYRATMARQWDKAITLYSQSIALNSNNPDVYFQRAVAYQMAKLYGEAIADYEKALKLRPDWYLAMEYLARLYNSQGYYEMALLWYQRSLPLMKNPKWRGVIKHWISETRKKMNTSSKKGNTKRKAIP
jgi:tetratricopeptide (TPR) repeat protein